MPERDLAELAARVEQSKQADRSLDAQEAVMNLTDALAEFNAANDAVKAAIKRKRDAERHIQDALGLRGYMTDAQLTAALGTKVAELLAEAAASTQEGT